MADHYVRLDYDEFKAFEKACREFKETTHGEGTEYYHKSVRLPIGSITFEFHGPLVKARNPDG